MKIRKKNENKEKKGGKQMKIRKKNDNKEKEA